MFRQKITGLLVLVLFVAACMPDMRVYADNELQSVHITRALWKGDARISEESRGVDFDFLISTNERIGHADMGFIDKAGNNFILRASGYGDVQATITGGFGHNSDSGFYLNVSNSASIAANVPYQLVPPAASETYRWVLNSNVTVSKPAETAQEASWIGEGIVRHTPNAEGFFTVVDRNALPAHARGFTKIRVMSSAAPIDVTQGIAPYGNTSYGYHDSGIGSGYPLPGTVYILTILFDESGRALAYRTDALDRSGQGTTPPPVQPPTNNSGNPSYGSDIDPNYNQSKPSIFSDVGDAYWAKDAILALHERKVISGYPDGKFRPDKVVTRAEFAKIMVLAAGLAPAKATQSSFSDLGPNHWAAPFVEAAKSYLNGYSLPGGALVYNPDAPALREDISVAIVKLKGYHQTRFADRSIIQAMFKDYNGISEYAKDYVAIAVESNLISGFPDETFRAQQPITRAQAAAILYRAYQFGNDNKLEAGVEGLEGATNVDLEALLKAQAEQQAALQAALAANQALAAEIAARDEAANSNGGTPTEQQEEDAEEQDDDGDSEASSE